MDWIWLSDPFYRYRDAATGRFVGQAQVNEASKVSISSAQDAARAAGLELATGATTLGSWERGFRQQIKDEYVRQYALGIGGVDRMTARDRSSIGGMLADQYRYLDRMCAQAAAGEISEGQLIMRAAMYLNSSREALFRAQGRARGIDTGMLPDYPGSGNTRCLTNCMCSWVFRKRGDAWFAYWTLSSAEHCPDCLEHADVWAPYEVPLPAQE